MSKKFVIIAHVKHPFKYSGKELKQGDIFEPEGLPNDLKILESNYIRKETIVEDAPRPRQRRRKKTT